MDHVEESIRQTGSLHTRNRTSLESRFCKSVPYRFRSVVTFNRVLEIGFGINSNDRRDWLDRQRSGKASNVY
jgi:hypothetical protein